MRPAKLGSSKPPSLSTSPVSKRRSPKPGNRFRTKPSTACRSGERRLTGPAKTRPPRKLGGWLDGSYFEARATRDPGRTDPGAFDTVLAYSLGDAAGRNPVDGGATWKGAAVGFDARPGSVHPVLGSATLTVDLAPWSSFPHIAAVDIVLGDLRRVSDPQFIYDDIRFDRVPLLDGEFADEPVTPAVVGEFPMRHRVRGAFYGSDHAEAGGTFVTAPTGDHREQAIVGAFGARRGE